MAPVNDIDPEVVATELAGKLSARTRHVCTFLGAGASRAAGLPDLAGLQAKVVASLVGVQQAQAEELFRTKNLEGTLSYLRRLVAVLEVGQTLGPFTAASAEGLQQAITNAIVPALDHSGAAKEPFEHLASWVSGGYYCFPVEVFTINYDLLVETGLESLSVPYFDGFVGNINGRFRAELVDTAGKGVEESLPPQFVRLWKLHGSVNWKEEVTGGARQVFRLGVPASGGVVAAIYPSDEKYDQSRRVPFVVLMDRFRRALAMPETVTLISGYSFGDQHLNEMIFDAARAHPRNETMVFCFSDIPDAVAKVALATRNISVVGANEAIRGGQRLHWSRPDDLPGVWEGGKFLLGNFASLARFLATKVRVDDGGA